MSLMTKLMNILAGKEEVFANQARKLFSENLENQDKSAYKL